MADEQASVAQHVSDLIKQNEIETRRIFGPTSAEQIPDDPKLLHVRETLRNDFSVFHPNKRPRASSTEHDVVDGGKHAPSMPENGSSKALVVSKGEAQTDGTAQANGKALIPAHSFGHALQLRRSRDEAVDQERPVWHPPWQSYRVISGHLGWVRCVAFDASNAWFATGSADRTVKIWDSATGRLKLTLTGHVSTVRGISISGRHPYMFTVGEDKMVKCWDLEQNKVIRNYHGHLSGVYCVSLHPVLDVLVTGGRDSTVRVWDVRTRAQVFVMGGHRDTVNSVLTQPVDPQVISASVDSTIRTWDLAAGKCSATLTNHKKGVRALAAHPREFSFASASADNIKTWALPEGMLMRNFSGAHGGKLVNAVAVNEDGVLASGADDGTVAFWDYNSAHCFQKARGVVQPGSLECENGIYGLAFDRSGSRLVTCETDKTVRMWREDEEATEETNPVVWHPSKRDRY